MCKVPNRTEPGTLEEKENSCSRGRWMQGGAEVVSRIQMIPVLRHMVIICFCIFHEHIGTFLCDP